MWRLTLFSGVQYVGGVLSGLPPDGKKNEAKIYIPPGVRTCGGGAI